MEKRYVLHRDNPKTPVKRVRIAARVLEKRVGLAKSGIRYAIFKITDGTGVINASLFGKPEESSRITEGDFIDIVGRVTLSEYTKSTSGKVQERVEWQIQIESVSVQDLEFMSYFALKLFETRAPLSPFLDDLYVDKMYEIRHLKSPNFGSEKNALLKEVISKLLKARTGVVNLEYLFGIFDLHSEDIMAAIYELKQECSLVQPEFGKIIWIGYKLPIQRLVLPQTFDSN